MQFLDLHENELTGLVPASIAEMKFLKALQLQGNKLSGELPNSMFGSASQLELVNLGDNGFSGGLLGKGIGNLTRVVALGVYNTRSLGQFLIR